MTTIDSSALWPRLIDAALAVPTHAIPDEVFSRASDRIVDTVACGLAAAGSNEGLCAQRLVLAEAAPGVASVWASGGQTAPAAMATLSNGTLIHAIDYDDAHAGSALHPGAVIVPAAIAIGEEVGARGPDVLASVALGYEVAARLAMQAPGRFQSKGFHVTGIIGIFGATAAVARLTGASATVAANAGGISGSMAGGLMEYLSDGSDVKQLHPGWTGQAAIRAVQLASHGLTGPRTVLEGTKGVYQAFVDHKVNAEAILEGFGRRWMGMEVATKRYPACYFVHAAVDAWKILRQDRRIAGARIKHLIALVPEFYLQLVGEPIDQKRRPRSTYEARFSLPYALAVAVRDGDITTSSFNADRLRDPEILELMSKVECQPTEYSTFPGEFPGGVRVVLEDGSTFEAKVEHNIGGPKLPLAPADLDLKLLEASMPFKLECGGRSLLRSIRGLCARSSDLREFSREMAKFSGPSR